MWHHLTPKLKSQIVLPPCLKINLKSYVDDKENLQDRSNLTGNPGYFLVHSSVTLVRKKKFTKKIPFLYRRYSFLEKGKTDFVDETCQIGNKQANFFLYQSLWRTIDNLQWNCKAEITLNVNIYNFSTSLL